MAQEIKSRVLIAKVGLDGHDRGSRLVTRLLVEAGFEVIYSGLRQTPETIVRSAIQEDADVIGISILSGSHMNLVPRILDLLAKDTMNDIAVVVGGIIPDDDAEELKKLGVAAVMGPGSSTEAIVDLIGKVSSERHAKMADGL